MTTRRAAVLAAAFVAGACGSQKGPGADAPSVSQAPQAQAPASRPEFSTDFGRSLVPFEEILSGGPSREGIPSIDNPVFVSGDAADWLADPEPVLVVSVGSQTRVYPLQILAWHEIVNDSVGGVPIAVTYCPLCNTGIAFERRLGDRTLDFGTTGRLRFSNLLMYDRQTETWWQQADGRAVIGELVGQRLRMVPTLMLSWRDARSAFPEAMVLSRETGFRRPYGR